MLEVGDRAPDFRVGERTLYELLAEREAVVFFFPKAFTPGWTREAGGFRREYDTLKAAGAEVIGVSADSQQRNDEFGRSLELPYRLLGDPQGELLKAYGVRWPVLGLARRVSYVIGRDRRVRHAHASELQAESHVEKACAFVARPPAR